MIIQLINLRINNFKVKLFSSFLFIFILSRSSREGISLIDTAETFTILHQLPEMVPTQRFRSNPLRGCYLPQNSGITNWDNEFLSRNYVTLSLETHLGKINRISRYEDSIE